MDRLISEFIDYLRFERYRSECTVDAYGRDLWAFKDYVAQLDAHLDWTTVDRDVIRGWMECMMDKGNSPASVNRRLSSLRAFYRFALSTKRLLSDPAHGLKGPKTPRPLPQYLREEEMDRLLEEHQWGDTFKDVRDRTIILTFYSAGLRLSELIGLNDASIDSSAAQLKVLGKRNKERVVPYGAELADALKEYRRRRDEEVRATSGALFVTYKGERMTPGQVRAIVRANLAKVSTMKKRSPHVLRHTFATAMLNNDSGLQSIQKLLGHQSVATTEIYTHTTFEQLRQVYGKAHPRGDEEEVSREKSY